MKVPYLKTHLEFIRPLLPVTREAFRTSLTCIPFVFWLGILSYVENKALWKLFVLYVNHFRSTPPFLEKLAQKTGGWDLSMFAFPSFFITVCFAVIVFSYQSGMYQTFTLSILQTIKKTKMLLRTAVIFFVLKEALGMTLIAVLPFEQKEALSTFVGTTAGISITALLFFILFFGIVVLYMYFAGFLTNIATPNNSSLLKETAKITRTLNSIKLSVWFSVSMALVLLIVYEVIFFKLLEVALWGYAVASHTDWIYQTRFPYVFMKGHFEPAFTEFLVLVFYISVYHFLFCQKFEKHSPKPA